MLAAELSSSWRQPGVWASAYDCRGSVAGACSDLMLGSAGGSVFCVSLLLLSLTSVSVSGEERVGEQSAPILLTIPLRGSARYFGLRDKHGERRPFSTGRLINSRSLSARDCLASHFSCNDAQKGSSCQRRPAGLRLWPPLSCLSL